MILQERDREILERCYEQQFLLVDHVQRGFFKGCHRRKAYERIQELERAGFIRRSRSNLLGGRGLLRLTREGVGLVQSWSPIRIPQVKRLDFSTLEHDAIVTSVALRLRELWDGVWIPERALKAEEFSRVPDGVFAFDSGAKAAIEVENSLKGRSRFLSLLERWRGSRVEVILYVATRSHLAETLKSWLAMGPKGVSFALVEWAALEAGTPLVWSRDGDLDLFSRRSL